MKEDYIILNEYLNKKLLTYNEFNELIGNYFVDDYEELEENYYLIKIIRLAESNSTIYTDYIQIMKD